MTFGPDKWRGEEQTYVHIHTCVHTLCMPHNVYTTHMCTHTVHASQCIHHTHVYTHCACLTMYTHCSIS